MQIAILFMWNRNAKGPIVHFKCPSTDLKCWSKTVNLHFCRLVSTYYVEYVLGNFSSVKEKNGYFLPFLLFLLEMQNSLLIPVKIPSPALRGFWWYGISVYGPFEQPGQ